MNQGKEKFRQAMAATKRFLRRNGSIVAAGACAVMVGVVFAISTTRNQPQPSSPAPVPPTVAAQQQGRQQTATTPAASQPEKTTPATTQAVAQTAVKQQMVWPVRGEIQQVFALDKLVYQSTLNQWMVHPALDIQAQPGIDVGAALDGTVESAREDKMLGKMVIMVHEGNLKTTYASLKTIDVAIGDTLKAGDKLGTVGQTALEEINQGSHLHFAVEKDGVAVDPLEYLPQSEDAK